MLCLSPSVLSYTTWFLENVIYILFFSIFLLVINPLHLAGASASQMKLLTPVANNSWLPGPMDSVVFVIFASSVALDSFSILPSHPWCHLFGFYFFLLNHHVLMVANFMSHQTISFRWKNYFSLLTSCLHSTLLPEQNVPLSMSGPRFSVQTC